MGFNFNEMQNAQEFSGEGFARPQAGGYVMKVIAAEENTQKQYFKLTMDYAEGEFKNYGEDMEQRTGWQAGYIVDYASYKKAALGLMKYRCRLFSEANSRFDSQRAAGNPREFIGKVIGVVLQEEEYTKKNGDVGTRLRVHKLCSPEDIESGNFKVPDKKLLPQTNQSKPSAAAATNINIDYGDLPF